MMIVSMNKDRAKESWSQRRGEIIATLPRERIPQILWQQRW